MDNKTKRSRVRTGLTYGPHDERYRHCCSPVSCRTDLRHLDYHQHDHYPEPKPHKAPDDEVGNVGSTESADHSEHCYYYLTYDEYYLAPVDIS